MSKPEPKAPEGFYRYFDADGQVHIVDDLETIPAKFRDKAEKIEAKGKRDVFSFVDDEGHTLIADSVEAIPKKYRDLAKKVSVEDAKKTVKKLEKSLEGVKTTGLVKAKEAQREVGDVVPFVKDLDIPSVIFGIALAVVVSFVLSLFKRTGKTLAKLGMVVMIVALVAGSYFAWIRRVAGLGETKLSSPTAMIDDAKKAAAQMQKKLDSQQKLLEQIEKNER